MVIQSKASNELSQQRDSVESERTQQAVISPDLDEGRLDNEHEHAVAVDMARVKADNSNFAGKPGGSAQKSNNENILTVNNKQSED